MVESVFGPRGRKILGSASRSQSLQQGSQIGPWQSGAALAGLPGVAAIDQPWLEAVTRQLLAPEIEAVKKVGCHGAAGLDLDDVALARFRFDEGIDFVSLLVAKEMEIRTEAMVEAGLEEFRHGPVLEEGAAQRMGAQMGRLTNAHQPSGESGITEVEFGGFDQPLGEIGEPGRYPEDEVAGLQDRQPGFGGQPGDSGVGGEGGDVDELSDSSGTQGQEALEGAQVLDAKDLTDIPLDIGGDIVLEPIRSRDGAIMDGRKEASLEENIDRGRGAACGLEFRHRKRQQREQTGSAGEALGDGSHPFELTGAGQKKSARTRIRIDGSLEVGEQRWAALDFVENGLGAELAQKAAGVLGGEGACVGIFQGKVGGVGGGRPGQGGLARLTGTSDDHDGVRGQSPLKQWRDETWNRMSWEGRGHYG